jgi:hypothetical protein
MRLPFVHIVLHSSHFPPFLLDSLLWSSHISISLCSTCEEKRNYLMCFLSCAASSNLFPFLVARSHRVLHILDFTLDATKSTVPPFHLLHQISPSQVCLYGYFAPFGFLFFNGKYTFFTFHS